MKISDQFAINVLMRREAILATKEMLRRQGHRVSLIRVAEIHSLARQHLAAHQDELYALAKAKWEAINARTGNGLASASALRPKAR